MKLAYWLPSSEYDYILWPYPGAMGCFMVVDREVVLRTGFSGYVVTQINRECLLGG